MSSDNSNRTALTYLDFELEVEKGNGRRYLVKVIESPAGQAQEVMRFPFNDAALENHLQALQIALLRSASRNRRLYLSEEEQKVQRFGQALFDALFTGEVRIRYAVSKSLARSQQRGLRLKLRIQSPSLAALPWEFLFDPGQAEYLSLSRHTPIVRYLECPTPPEPLLVDFPLRILGMIVSPTDLAGLDVEQERERIEKAIAPLRARGSVELTWLSGQTWRDLLRAMRTDRHWHVFHFIGHGGFDTARDEGRLAFADDQGKQDLLSATQVGRLLAEHLSLRLVILNACEGARGSQHDIFSSTAATLVQRGIPAVLAMQYEITDQAAIELSRNFYEAISDGMPADAAIGEARKAISLEFANSMEWGTPVLYMHAPNGELFHFSQQAPAATQTPATPAAPQADMLAPAHLTAAASAPSAGEAPDAAPVAPPDQAGPPHEPAQRGISRRILLGLAGLVSVGVVAGGLTWFTYLSQTQNASSVRTALPIPQDFPMAGFDAQRTHFNPDERRLASENVARLKLAWKKHIDQFASPFNASPTLANGNVYVGSENHSLYAFNATTGDYLWTAVTGGNIRYSSAAIFEGYVYVGSLDGMLYAFKTNGKPGWTYQTGNEIVTSPAIANGILYFGSDDGYVYALTASNGQYLWRASVRGLIGHSSPAVSNSNVYVGSAAKHLFAFEAYSGNLLWSQPVGDRINSTPAVVNGVVYAGAWDGKLYAIKTDSGQILWATPAGNKIDISSPAVANGVVYIGSLDHHLYAIDAESGKVLWRTATGDTIYSSPVVANGVVYVGSDDRNLYAMDARHGQILWQYQTESGINSSPAVANGTLYISGLDQNIYAFR